VPYGALAHMSRTARKLRILKPREAKALRKSERGGRRVIGPHGSRGDQEEEKEPLQVSSAHGRRVHEACDLLTLSYHKLRGFATAQDWPRSVREEVLRAVVELRFYKLCMPLRERYLEFVEELLTPQEVERTIEAPRRGRPRGAESAYEREMEAQSKTAEARFEQAIRRCWFQRGADESTQIQAQALMKTQFFEWVRRSAPMVVSTG